MFRMWSARWLAVGGLALALGCRTHPPVPVCTTPLLPEVVAPTPPISSATPKPIEPPTKFDSTTVAKVAAPAVVMPPVDRIKSDRVPKDEPAAVAIVPPPTELPRPKPGADGFGPGSPTREPVREPVVVPVAMKQKQALSTPLPAGETIGHGAGYRWVVGIADRHGKNGSWTIRFADIGVDDPWGGKVRLMDDAALRNLQNGDRVYVEGELLAPATATNLAAYPPYRIRSLQIVEKAN